MSWYFLRHSCSLCCYFLLHFCAVGRAFRVRFGLFGLPQQKLVKHNVPDVPFSLKLHHLGFFFCGPPLGCFAVPWGGRPAALAYVPFVGSYSYCRVCDLMETCSGYAVATSWERQPVDAGMLSQCHAGYICAYIYIYVYIMSKYRILSRLVKGAFWDRSGS
jgi:hypothetical protein